jgi:hypothetical protein
MHAPNYALDLEFLCREVKYTFLFVEFKSIEHVYTIMLNIFYLDLNTGFYNCVCEFLRYL